MKTSITLLLLLFLSFLGPAQSPTYTKDIAPIIYQHCTSCHRPGEIGPMPFTNYAEVSAWAGMVQYVTETRYMPPWKPDPTYSSVLGENYLNAQEIDLIRQWVMAGAPEGNPADEPPLPVFPTGSVLGQPDLVLRMEETYTHIGGNEDEYRIFVIPTGLTADRDIAAIELRPGNRQIVHHALFSWDTTGQAQVIDINDPGYGYNGFGGFGIQGTANNQYPGYVPGQIPRLYPQGIGQKMYKGSDLLVQMHYAPWPTVTTDSSTINIFFKKEPAQRYVERFLMVPLPSILVNGPFFLLPEEQKTFHGVIQVPTDVSLLNLAPHCHLLGTDWEIYAVQPTGDTVPLLRIPEWDFNWQGGYLFDRLIKLEAGAEIHALCTYDNTTANPNNPNNPPKFVTWGEKTTDEMYYLPINYVPYQMGDELIDLTTDALDDLVVWPEDKLYTVFPNPSTGEVNVSFSVGDNQRISIALFDLEGKKLKAIAQDRYYAVGNHTLTFQATDLADGVYVVRLEGSRWAASEKLMIR